MTTLKSWTVVVLEFRLRRGNTLLLFPGKMNDAFCFSWKWNGFIIHFYCILNIIGCYILQHQISSRICATVMLSSALKHLRVFAKAIRDGNPERADSSLKQIWKLADDESDEGQSVVVRYFAEALVLRAYGLHSAGTNFSLHLPPIATTSFKWSYNFFKIVKDTIINAMMGKKELHLIGFDMPTMHSLKDLMGKLEGPYADFRSVRVSVILPTSLEKKTAYVQNERRRFNKPPGANVLEMEELKIVYANSLGEVDESMLDFRRDNEAVVICYSFKLHKLLAQTGAMERELSKLRYINPETVIIAEQNADHNNSDFIQRLDHSFEYYSNVFRVQTLWDTERNSYRKQMHNIVGCDGEDRIHRHQTWAQWKSHLQSAGCLQFPLVFSDLTCGSGTDVRIHEHEGSAVFTLNYRSFFSLSAWKLADQENSFNPTNNNFVQGFNPSPVLEDTIQPFEPFRKAFWLNHLAALCEIYDMLEEVCFTHQLPLALTWDCGATVSEYKRGASFMHSAFSYVKGYPSIFKEFIKTCEKQRREEQAIVAKALQSSEDFHFEPDYPFADDVRKYIWDRYAAVVICLQNRYAMDVDYVVEFFLPASGTEVEKEKSLALRIFNNSKNMKKRFVTVRVRGTRIGFQEETISNIPHVTTPVRSPPPASSTGHIMERQGLIEQGSGNNENEMVKADVNNLPTSSAKRRRRNNLPASSAKGRRTSHVWKEFDRKKNENGEVRAICQHCKRDFNGASGQGTTHLNNHLKSCRIRKANVRNQQPIIPTGRAILSKNESAKEGNSSFDQDKRSMDFARTVIKYQYPLKIVEHFSLFLENLPPKLHSQEALSSYIVRVYKEEKNKLLEYFDKLSCRFNLIISLWEDDFEKTTYWCYAVQFIDENWQLKKKILALESSKNQFGKRIFCKSFQKFLLEWKFMKKVCSLAIHNSSSCFEIAQEIRRKRYCFLDSHPSSAFFFSSGLLCEDNSGENIGKSIDGVIRTSNACLLDIFRTYSVTRQQEGRVYPLMNVISDNNWGTCSLVLAIATVLDPQFRFRFVDFSYKQIYGNDAANIHLEKIRDVLTRICLEYASNLYGDTLPDNTNSSTLSNLEEDIMESLYSYSEKMTYTEESWKSELTKYVNQELVKPYNPEFDILGWWCEQASSFPILGRMVRDILAIPLSSIISGSFTEKDMLSNPIFSGLDIEIIEAMICSRDWIDSPKENDRANHAPLQNKAKRKMEEKEATEVKSCKIRNYGETGGGDKSKPSCKMVGSLSVENVQPEGRPLKSSEPNHGRNISHLIEIPNGAPSFDNQSEFQCSSSESDGEIGWREQRAWNAEDVRAYLVSSFTEKEKKRLNKWQSHVPKGTSIGRDKKFRVVDYKLRPLLIIPHGVETQVDYYIDDSIVNIFFELLKKRSDRFPKAYVNHYSFPSQIATNLIERSRPEDEVLERFKHKKLRGVHKMFLPICLSAHWVLFYVDTKEKKFSWLDSNECTRMSNNVEKGAILKWFKRSLLPTFGFNDANEWPFELPTDIPVQKNRVDCGVFVMKYADCLTHDNFFPFKQEDMPHFRRRTFLDIYRGRLDGQK